MKSFCLVWSTLLDSTLWVSGSKESRLVWIALLALKDKKGEVHNTVAGLAHRAIVTFKECQMALEFLSSPDPHSQNKEEGGRRIVAIEGGWRIVSHDKYRFGSEAARAYWRESKRIQRNKKSSKQVHSENQAREERFIKAYERGDDQKADEIISEGL